MKQRITYKPKRPNPLIEEYLEMLHKQAQISNSKREPMLREALNSLSKYPLPLKSGAECAILKGFSGKLCKYLDDVLQNYNSTKNNENEENSTQNVDGHSKSHTKRKKRKCDSDDAPKITSSVLNNVQVTQQCPESVVLLEKINLRTDCGLNVGSSWSARTETNSSPNNKKNKCKERIYKPAHRSGAYAILIALLEHMQEHPNDPGLVKENIIDRAQRHSEESFVRPKPDSFYTAWSNITRLVTKGLVVKTKNKKVFYSLTLSGISLATDLVKESRNIPSVNDIIFNATISSTSSVCNSQETVVSELSDAKSISSQLLGSQSSDGSATVVELPAGSFDVILLIDKNETGGVSKKNDPTVAQFNKYPDLKHEYRSLKVGDFTWIARHKVNKEELVLPYVVERKRMDDFGSSIKDGRFHEQKFRLRKCGLKNVIYMVENFGSNKHVGLPLQSLKQALANTRVQDGFKTHLTDSLNNSARFLAMLTKRLTIEFKNKSLKGHNQEPTEDHLMTFQYFNKFSSKTKPLTVTETFIKLLLQLKGVSVEKAITITNVYSTPISLIRAYSHCSPKEGEMLLANLKYGDTTRNVGPKTSKTIYQLFSHRHLS